MIYSVLYVKDKTKLPFGKLCVKKESCLAFFTQETGMHSQEQHLKLRLY